MPYSPVTFNSGDELPAASLTQLMANIAALKDGSALDANIVTATLLDLITRSGWLPLTALTRTADTTVTLVGDWTDRIPVGAKLRWLSAGSARYNYIIAVAYSVGTGLTTLTITGGYITAASDMCFKNADAITAMQYSLVSSPVGFPEWFNYTPTRTVPAGTVPTYAVSDLNRFHIQGRTVYAYIEWINASGGTAGGGTGPLCSNFPVPPRAGYADGSAMLGGGQTYEAGGTTGIMVIFKGSATVFELGLYTATTITGNDQSSAGRQISGSYNYEI